MSEPSIICVCGHLIVDLLCVACYLPTENCQCIKVNDAQHTTFTIASQDGMIHCRPWGT